MYLSIFSSLPLRPLDSPSLPLFLPPPPLFPPLSSHLPSSFPLLPSSPLFFPSPCSFHTFVFTLPLPSGLLCAAEKLDRRGQSQHVKCVDDCRCRSMCSLSTSYMPSATLEVRQVLANLSICDIKCYTHMKLVIPKHVRVRACVCMCVCMYVRACLYVCVSWQIARSKHCTCIAMQSLHMRKT